MNSKIYFECVMTEISFEKEKETEEEEERERERERERETQIQTHCIELGFLL